jgi:hypothetical protein
VIVTDGSIEIGGAGYAIHRCRLASTGRRHCVALQQ